MNPNRVCVWCAIASLVTLCVSPALATAPPEQRTTPILFQNLYSVVEMTRGAPAVLGDYVGTGTVVDKFQDPQTLNTYFCVLTADHNFPNSTTIAFGDNGAVGVANGDNRTFYPIVQTHRGGSNGMKDIALAIVLYGPDDPFYQGLQPIALWDPPDVDDATLVADIFDIFGGAAPKFTEIGFGDTGSQHFDGAGNQDGWNRVSSVGLQRFQNNDVTGANAGAAHAPYTYTDLVWSPHFPTAANSGEGSSFGGDSGGPYLMSESVTKTISGLHDIQGNVIADQNIDLFTNTEFVVHTFGSNANPQLFGGTHGGVLLTQSEIDWINQKCQVIPEPASFVLALAAAVSIVLWRRQKAR